MLRTRTSTLSAQLAIAGLLLTLVLQAPAAAQTAVGPPASLVGESFFTFTSFARPDALSVNATCNPDGTSTVAFTARGVATGPYPGPFIETGTFTIGEQSGSSGLFGGIPAGDVVDFNSTFMIDSADGQVTGSKELWLFQNQPPPGTCFDSGPNPGFQYICDTVGRPSSPEGAEVRNIPWSYSTYDAKIQRADGIYRDSGTASEGLSEYSVLCSDVPPPLFPSNVFRENFLTSNGVVPFNTPGQAEGGGQVLHMAGGAEQSVTFGLTARSDGTVMSGRCSVYYHASNHHLRCTSVTSYSQVGNTATFSGDAVIDGQPTTYRIALQDNGESAIAPDAFSIEVNDQPMYSVGGPVTKGNVQVK